MKLILSLLVAFLVSSVAVAATPEEDVAHYIAIFNGDTSRHNAAVESLAWKGISDPQMYDVIERRLLDEGQIIKPNKDEKNRVARYIRALGFSGQSKYTSTINKFLSNRTYERYAATALKEMSLYEAWNPVISNRSTFDQNYPDDVSRVLNMLRASDMQLKRIGAKRVYFAEKDAILLDRLAKELRANYQNVEDNEIEVDTVSWMVKALGSARNPSYRPLIEEVATKARSRKVAKYAKQALEL
jgi:hypothetical protein